MSSPRIIVRGATTAICRRTSFRKAFLAPWHPMVSDIWLYALADAARKESVAVHMTSLMPTHHHTQVTPSSDNLPAFVARLHTDVSCAVKELMAYERYEPPQNVWDGRPAHYMRLLDAEAQASQSVYDFVNPPAAGLVARPEHMPGRPFDFGMWKSGGWVIKKPPIFFDKRRASELYLPPEPQPLLLEAFHGDFDALIYWMRQLSRDALRDIQTERGLPPLGSQALRRMHPYDEPRSPAEPSGAGVPAFRIGTRGLVGRTTRIHACRETKVFRQEHERCRQARLAGEDPSFPHGTYAMRVRHGARVDEPWDDALLTAPGPLLHEVLERVQSTPEPEPSEREEMLDRLRTGFAEEAAAIVEHNELNFRRSESRAEKLEDDPDARPETETVHCSEPRRNWRRRPRRIITRRDTRRGRPNEKRGVDPPR